MKIRFTCRVQGRLLLLAPSGLLAILLAGCASPTLDVPEVTAPGQTAWSPLEQANWPAVTLPGKAATRYHLDAHAPRGPLGQVTALKAEAYASASMLRVKVRIEPEALGRVDFSWLVPELIANADMTVRGSDDSPVRLILAFDGDRSQFSAKDTLLNELARLLTGEEMPYATLMYVWCNQCPVGSVIQNARTDRIRKIVVESGSQGLLQWRSYARDIRADFAQAFGEPPGALVAVGLMTDSDNTHSQAEAWYGPIHLH